MKEQIMNLTREITNEDLKMIIKEAIQEAISNRDKTTLTVKEASEFTGIGRSKILELVHGNNDFPSFKVGSKFLINKELLVAWLEKISKEGTML